ncbi:Cytochrome P450 3A4 [Halocaridina rubra]|uniref:Cytochrome P450 3A4 n=1 Tax=Halocaridina rubra TaxID=373956 RepID=A0AAN8X9Q7_HALRR
MWLLSLLLLSTVVFVAFTYSRKRHNFWTLNGISTPPFIPFLGHAHKLYNKKQGRWIFENEVYSKFGGCRYAGIYEFLNPILIVGDPELMKNILVKDFDHFVNRRKQTVMTNERDSVMNHMLTSKEGDDWKALRSVMSPTFTSGRMKAMFPLVCEKANALVSFCRKEISKKPQIDMKYTAGRYTVDTLASCAFGIECNSLIDDDAAFPKKVSAFFNVPSSKLLLYLFYRLFPRMFSLLKINLNPPELDFFKEVVTHTIAERKRKNLRRDDFLDLLLEAEHSESETKDEQVHQGDEWPDSNNQLNNEEKEQDDNVANKKDTVTQHQHQQMQKLQEHVQNESTEEKHENVKNAKKTLKGGLDDNAILAQCLLFLVAGYDTTASTLAFASFLLAKHPKEQDTLRQELRELLEEKEGKLTYDTLIDAKFLDSCIMETLRLYPPGPRLQRMCNKSYRLPGTEFTIPKGMVVQCQVWSVHHDARYWPDPEKFSPDRFMPENRPNIKSFTHIPFGMGPRNCIGMRFALMEVKVALAKLVLAAEMKLAPGSEELILEGGNSSFLRPKYGVNLILKPLGSE